MILATLFNGGIPDEHFTDVGLLLRGGVLLSGSAHFDKFTVSRVEVWEGSFVQEVMRIAGVMGLVESLGAQYSIILSRLQIGGNLCC